MTASRKTLEDVLLTAQRLGTLGDRPIPEVIEHARYFVRALEGVTGRVADIGTGAGVPGLVIAVDRPDLDMVLVDRRENRMDELSRGVASMGLSDRVQVLIEDVGTMGTSSEFAAQFDAVVCRGFGPPDLTARLARPLLKNGGRLVVSEPPLLDPSRWPEDLLQRTHFGPPEYLLGVVVLTATPEK
jgi:16S rRNA (guanine527-N7)-methyltransferase